VIGRPAVLHWCPDREPCHIDCEYDVEPSKLFYTHISDQYASLSTKMVTRSTAKLR